MQAEQICMVVDNALAQARISRQVARPKPLARFAPFRVSPTPYHISTAQYHHLVELGYWLRDFYWAMDKLYRWSQAGLAPAFVARHLDVGKPEWLLRLAGADAFRQQIPLVIRPDLLLTEQGFRATELDAVPGSIGLLAFLENVYRACGFQLLGEEPTQAAFLAALLHLANGEAAAIAFSEECLPYQRETTWLSQRWSETGQTLPTVRVEDLVLDASGVALRGKRLGLIYRFFELFDLDNIPGANQLLELAAAGKVRLTAPPKPHLEEKMWFAWLHHPELATYWRQLLPEKAYYGLKRLIPETWLITDDPQAFAGGPFGSWEALRSCSRKQRNFVLKPSGFSPQAWGGRGFSRGKDYGSRRWMETLDGLRTGPPYVLQEYLRSVPLETAYFDFNSRRLIGFTGKLRLCPYYFIVGDQVRLSGALATIVPLEKPIIHGMTEAVMVPTAVAD